jgi:CHAT domain-containing protein
VRIEVFRKSAVVGALILFGIFFFSHRIFTRLRRVSQESAVYRDKLSRPDSTDPQGLLAEANRFYWLNNGPRAGPLYAKAEALFAQQGDPRNELYAKIGRLRSEAEAMSFVDLSRFLKEQLNTPIVRNDAELRLWCLTAKGYTDIEVDYQAEKRDWLEAQEIAKRLGESRWATRASGELGIIAFLEGHTGQGARLLGTALVSTMTNGDTGGQIRFLEMLGNGMMEVNRNSEALMFFERAIKLAAATQDSGLPFMGYEGKAAALVALGEREQAKRVLDDALVKARLQQKQGHSAGLLIVLGKLAVQQGNEREAIADFEEAGQLATRVRFYRMEADAMFELAKLYRDLGDIANADASATQALAASQHVGDHYYVPRNLTVLADLKARRGRMTEAKQLYEQAEDVIDGMLGADDSYWNSSIAAAMSQTYLEHFELLAKQGDTAEAFRTLERVRGRTLAIVLADTKAAPKSGDTETAAVDSYVANIQSRIMQANGVSDRQQLLDELAEYEWRSRLAWNQGDHRFPLEPVPLAEVQTALTPDETVLEYVLDEPNSFCIVISRKHTALRALPIGRKAIEQVVQRYVDDIRAKRPGTENARQLYRWLLQPVAELAAGRRLIIVPDGMLNLLPFDALEDSDGQYLLKSVVISYAPSATVLDALRRGAYPQIPPRPFLGLGDVAYENQGAAGRSVATPDTLRGRLARGFAEFARVQLYDLPQTRTEVENIGKIVGKNAEILLGTAATESALKKEPLNEFRVLHLAVHSFADPQYPERSALVLGADPKSKEDGLLQVREIKRLRLNAQLTTLSACDSGVGKLQGEEGVSDLAEAFLAAGSKTVVASLWSADDTFTAALMERFYQRLASRESTSSALHGAKLDMLTKYGEQASPFYWAAFVAIGDASAPIGIREQ